MRRFRDAISLIAMTILIPLLAACASAPAASTAETYPAWLEMKEGYAQTCIDHGGCVPMSQRELQELVGVIQQRTLEFCARSSI